MRVTFVYSEHEALGVEYVSAALEAAGHETQLVFDPRLFADSAVSVPGLARIFSQREEVIEGIVRTRPDLLAFSVLTHTFPWFLDIAREAKRRIPVPVLAGGIHPTLVPAEVIAHPEVDYVCVGEGEAAAVDLANALEGGEAAVGIPNLWAKQGDRVVPAAPRALVEDLDSLPFPNKRLFVGTPVAPADLYLAIASRGCAYECTYCTENAIRRIYRGRGRILRARGVGPLIAELKEARRNIPYRVVWFCDEIFTWNVAWLREFAPRYRSEIGVPFLALVHPRFVDEEVAGLLALAGCVKVDMGVQTVSPALRREVLGRNESDREVVRAIESLKRAGVWVDVDNIVNLPGETTEDLVRTAAFYNDHRPDTAKFYWLQIYPGTEMAARVAGEGLAVRNDTAASASAVPAEPASYYRGDPGAPREKRQIHLYLMILLFLPEGVNRFILGHALYRWLPAPRWAARYHHLLLNLLNHAVEWTRWRAGLDRRNWPAIRSMSMCYGRLYRGEILRWARRRESREARGFSGGRSGRASILDALRQRWGQRRRGGLDGRGEVQDGEEESARDHGPGSNGQARG